MQKTATDNRDYFYKTISLFPSGLGQCKTGISAVPRVLLPTDSTRSVLKAMNLSALKALFLLNRQRHNANCKPRTLCNLNITHCVT